MKVTSDNLEVKYGLPAEVKFCKKCNMSNQQPMSSNEYKHGKNDQKETIGFNSEGVCYACTFNEFKDNGSIDWVEREKELIELCDKYRKNDGSYDCIVGGSGGKDSAFQSHILKYKYKMNPLTVTWAPHLYTDIGWANFQNWVHVGGFDNFLYTPNGKIHREFTRQATINLLHPFQPFILGQKNFVSKMAAKFNIPLIFYGEVPAEYGENMNIKTKKFSGTDEKAQNKGYTLNPLAGVDIKEALIGGKKVGQYLEEGMSLVEINSYLPLDPNILSEKKIDFYYLGYFLRWVPQEAYYYAVENTGFKANTERTEGTYSKYNSLDDKIDGFFYYTRYIKFGVGRAMMDSAQEIRNHHLLKEEGQALIKKFDGEYPVRYEKEFLDYVSMSKEEFMNLCDQFRSPHLWHQVDGKWELRHKAWETE
ncbi:MAG: N-acetyl sugar amidotransferase [Bdellovibrionaceae bacterium]|nr:N-acetyl sugar amidotransferase [Pseudobdellovibrionaceae bacterium]